MLNSVILFVRGKSILYSHYIFTLWMMGSGIKIDKVSWTPLWHIIMTSLIRFKRGMINLYSSFFHGILLKIGNFSVYVWFIKKPPLVESSVVQIDTSSFSLLYFPTHFTKSLVFWHSSWKVEPKNFEIIQLLMFKEFTFTILFLNHLPENLIPTVGTQI